MTWRALHVHRYTAQDTFLVAGLAPQLARLRADGVLRRTFFLRYWQGGPHVRVRLLLDPAHADAVTDELARRLGRWLGTHRTADDFDADQFHRDAQPTLAALEGGVTDLVHPPDTVRAVPYEPEFDKYGGPLGVAVAEEFFDASSAAVLAALPGIAERSGRRLGAGFVAMLRGQVAAGHSAAELAAFFAHYCLLWSPYVFDEFLRHWPELLRVRRPALQPPARAAIAEAAGADPVGAAVGRAWAAVRAAESEVLPAVTLLGADASSSRRRRTLLVSYLHTHNNRLGLTPEQEAFLGYLGHHVLSDLAGTPPSADLLDTLRHHRARRLAGDALPVV